MSTLVVSPGGRRYGFFPSAPDHRDFGLPRFVAAESIVLPAIVDLEPSCGPVKDQGALGACTAFASTGNREYLSRKFENAPLVFSPLFQYYQERKIDGSLDEGDCGSTGRTACIALQSVGVCLEQEDTYNPQNFQIAPTEAEISQAVLHRAGAYHALSNVVDMKKCLASGYPFLIGFTVYESFESAEMARTGLMAPVSGGVLGGHEVLVIGYDDSKQCPGGVGAFKVRNSWSAVWGDKGNFWFPYNIAATDVLIEAWIQHLWSAWK